MKVIIVGGVAGGASCAARLRRLDEKAEIVMVERGPYLSYANCGLPYHVGGVIEKESSLLVASGQMFRGGSRSTCGPAARRSRSPPENKTVDLRDVATGEVTTESYDKLVLSPGAPSVRPPLPGIDLPGIFHVRTVPDARADPRVDRARARASWPACTRTRASRRAAEDPRGGRRRRVHRPRDGGEPRAPRVRRDARRDGSTRCSPRSTRNARASSRTSSKRHGVRLVLGRRGGRVRAVRERRAQVLTQSGKALSGRRGDPRARRATRHRRWRGRPASRSASAAGSASTSRCARATRTSSPSATPSR